MKKILTIFLVFGGIAFSVFAKELPYWKKNDSSSQKQIQHQVWDDFLQKNIQSMDAINLIAYEKISEQEKENIKNYVQYLESIVVTSYNPKEQKAYWINLYNALTVKVILDHYPVDSIRDIKLSGIFIPGPWRKKLVKIENQELSLDNIEHNILRPIWKDNRVHYAVNCASIGCPNLQNRAFTSLNTEELLEKGAAEYVNHPRGVQFQGNKLILSSIYKWFQEDFEGNEQGVLRHLQKYAEGNLKTQLQASRQKIQYYYDWSLNQMQ